MNLDRIFESAYRGMMVKQAAFDARTLGQEPWKSYWNGYHAGVTHRRMTADVPQGFNKDLYIKGFNDARGSYGGKVDLTKEEQEEKDGVYNQWKGAYSDWISRFKDRAPQSYQTLLVSKSLLEKIRKKLSSKQQSQLQNLKLQSHRLVLVACLTQ